MYTFCAILMNMALVIPCAYMYRSESDIYIYIYMHVNVTMFASLVHPRPRDEKIIQIPNDVFFLAHVSTQRRALCRPLLLVASGLILVVLMWLVLKSNAHVSSYRQEHVIILRGICIQLGRCH